MNSKLTTHFKQSVLIWLLTNLLGALLLLAELQFSIVENNLDVKEIGVITLLALIFSFPVVLLLVPNFYALSSFESTNHRVAYALISIFFFCAIVVVSVAWCFSIGVDELEELMQLFLPYIAGAQASFWWVAHRNILLNDNV